MPIIWRGAGCVVPFVFAIFAVLGLAVGAAVGYGNAGMTLGLGGACVAVWFLGRAMNATPLRPDGAADDVPPSSPHTLYFIPMQYWAFPGVLLTIGFGWMMLTGPSGSDTPAVPESPAYRAANAQIASFHGPEAFGNSPVAQQIAVVISRELQAAVARDFEGGREHDSMTDDRFLTYVQLAPNGVAVLVHVPGFRDYRDEVREVLIMDAWEVAATAIAERYCVLEGHVEPQLLVALRGTLLYGASAQGPLEGPMPAPTMGYAISTDPFQALFASSAALAPDAIDRVCDELPPEEGSDQ